MQKEHFRHHSLFTLRLCRLGIKMEQLSAYLKECYRARDETEFVILDTFDHAKFRELQQDGLMICKNRPPFIPDMEVVSLGNCSWLIRKTIRTISWYDEVSKTANFTMSSKNLKIKNLFIYFS